METDHGPEIFGSVRSRCAGRVRMAFACAVLAPCLAGAGEGVTREVYSMGTKLRLSVWAVDRPTAVHASESALVAIEAVEARLSTWRRGSELDRLNHSAVRVWFSLSAELARDLAEVGHWWRETGGAFDPGVASLVEAWDLRGKGRRPTTSGVERAKSSAGFRHLELAGARARRLAEGFGVEEGGFGKGIALRDAAAAAKRAGAVCAEIDLGGQILLSGRCTERMIGVADPRSRDRVVAELPLRSGSVATSGSSERYVEIDGLEWSHILDPVTGQPAEDWGSVTVIADDPVAADCLATALYVMGPERGLEWAARRSDVEVVFAVVEGSDIRLVSTAMAARAGSNG